MREIIKEVLEEVITSKELAKLLGKSESQIRRMARDLKVESVLKGKTRLYDPKDFISNEQDEQNATLAQDK